MHLQSYFIYLYICLICHSTHKKTNISHTYSKKVTQLKNIVSKILRQLNVNKSYEFVINAIDQYFYK